MVAHVAPRYPVDYVDPHFSERFAKLPREAQKRLLELLGEIANLSPTLGRPCGYQPRRALCTAAGFAVEGTLREQFRLDDAYVDDVLMALDPT